MKNKARIKLKHWMYLAGLVDGDGSMSIRQDDKAYYQLTVSVYSTCLPLMKYLVRRFGGGYRPILSEGNRKQKYQWYTSSSDVSRCVSPHLVMKHAQGLIICKFLDLGSTRNPLARHELMIDLQNENQKFEPVTNTNRQIIQDKIINKLDFAYLAGIFDAEGSLSIFKRKPTSGNGRYTSAIRISNTDNRLFPWLMSRFGGNFSITTRESRNEGTWSLVGKKDRELKLLAMLPYLVVKRERAIVLLQWMRTNCSLTLAEKEAMFLNMRELNQRGLSPTTNTSRLPNQEDKIESELHGDMQSAPSVMATA